MYIIELLIVTSQMLVLKNTYWVYSIKIRLVFDF